MRLFRLFLLLLSVLFLSGCALSYNPVRRIQDLRYISETNPVYNAERHRLDVYAPKKNEKLKEVLVFIHGGSWNSGDKEIYKFLGSRFARRGILTVLINYRLSPGADYDEMTMDAARAVKWVKENIEAYGGDPEKILSPAILQAATSLHLFPLKRSISRG